MKNIIYSITFIFSAHFILGAVQQSARDEITLEVIKSAYESVVEGKYTLQGKTWTETRNIFEEKINLLKSLEDDSPGSYLDTLLQVNIWFAKFRFRNGEFMQFIDDLEFIETQIAKNDTSYGVYLSNIEEDVREIRNIFDKNVNNEEDIKFANLYIKIIDQEIPEKSRVVYSNGDPVRINFKSPTTELNDLQKSRLDYLNNTWFKDLSKQGSDMSLGFFTHTDSLEETYRVDDESLREGYVLEIPYLPILKEEQEYIFILQQDSDGEQKRRYRKKFDLKNYDYELLQIKYEPEWSLIPSPSPGEIELRLPADRYAIKTKDGIKKENENINYKIEIRNLEALDTETTIDPMEELITKGDGRSYYIYYIPYQENIQLEVEVNKTPQKRSKFENYIIWAAISLGIGGYYAQ